jgi:hypothetical protein
MVMDVKSGDTVGCEQAVGICSFMGRLPCRTCQVHREDMWNVALSQKCELRSSKETRPILEGAFAAFCKSIKKEDITEEEESKLKKCKKWNIQPLKIAMLEFILPFPAFTNFALSPPDLLHTFLSGPCRDYLVTVVVIGTNLQLYIHLFLFSNLSRFVTVSIFSSECKKYYSNTLSLLDESIASFQAVHSLKSFRIARFKKGVSEYVKSALKSNKSKGGGTTGMGGMRFQDMPSLILQLVICIGTNGDIIPNDYNDCHLGNVLKCVLVTGFKLLDLFLNLSRREFSKSTHIPELYISCQGKVI